MESMRSPLVAIFFVTYFYRLGGEQWVHGFSTAKHWVGGGAFLTDGIDFTNWLLKSIRLRIACGIECMLIP